MAHVLRVYLVEDNDLLRTMLTEIITTPGRIEVVGSAACESIALRDLALTEVDVAIVDLHLSQGTGFGVLRELSRRPDEERPVLIVLTNYDLALFRTRVEDLGADYFFEKSEGFGPVRAVLDGLLAPHTH